jgi:CARDB protein
MQRWGYGWLFVVAILASACVDKAKQAPACDPALDENCNILPVTGCTKDADCGDGKCLPDGTCQAPLTVAAPNACQTISCPAGRFCSNGQCLLASPQCVAADPACIFIPHGAFEQPAREWWWPFNTPLGPAGPGGVKDFRADLTQPLYVEVMSTPVVMRLHPADPEPAVVFNTFQLDNSGSGQFLESQGVMRAIRGSDSAAIWTHPDDVLNHLDQSVNANSGITSGDCTGSGEVCFITGGWDPTDQPCTAGNPRNCTPGVTAGHAHEHGGLIAIGNDGRTLWINRGVQVWWGAPAIARLLGPTGPAQVVVGNAVLDAATGKTLCAQTNDGGAVGNNGEGSLTTIADINLDGIPEIITGNQALRLVADATSPTGFTCKKLFGAGVQQLDPKTKQPVPCAGGSGSFCPDGFPAIANFAGYGATMALDPTEAHPQIVVVARGFLSIHDWTGGLLVDPIPLPQHTTGPNCDPTNNPGGPPTIADFDGDGLPEVGIASESSYSVWKPGAGFIWSSPTYDCSASTGSSVFDFEGKGNPTVVYSDQCTFSVLDGKTGAQLINENNASCTAYEMPVVADIDGSGRAKILVPNNDVCQFPCSWGNTALSGNVGLKALKSPTDKWVNTRSVWNEHTYHVSNVNLDGTLPFPEPLSWAAGQSNSFRQNVQGQGVFSSPDLSICESTVDMTNCATTGATITAVVYNGGAVIAQAGVTVDFFVVLADGSSAHIAQRLTTKALKPGDSESVSAPWFAPPQNQPVTVKAVVDQNAVIGDCHLDNNTSLSASPVKCSPFG